MRHKGGAPRKSPTGLNKVLYVRVDNNMIRQLDIITKERRKMNPGHVMSRADVVREMISVFLTD